MLVQVVNPAYCSHPDAVPVESAVDGQIVAALCPACDSGLPAAWLTCSHHTTIEISGLGEIRGRQVCNGCGATYWDGDKHQLAHFLNSWRVSFAPSLDGREQSET